MGMPAYASCTPDVRHASSEGGPGGPQLHHFLVQVFTASLCEHQHAECAALVGPDKLGVPWLSLNKHHCLTKSGFAEGFEPNVSSRFSILFHPYLQSLSPLDFIRSESKPHINLLFLFCAIPSYTSHAVKESLRPTCSQDEGGGVSPTVAMLSGRLQGRTATHPRMLCRMVGRHTLNEVG